MLVAYHPVYKCVYEAASEVVSQVVAVSFTKTCGLISYLLSFVKYAQYAQPNVG